MAASFKNSYTINASLDQLTSLLKNKDFTQKLNIEFKSENPTQSGVWFRFHHGVTFTSWGEKLTITLTPISAALVKVDIDSECGMPTQVIDWGKNKVNVLNIYEYIIKFYPADNTCSVLPPSHAANPAPDTVFCYSCGAKIKATHAFCGKCGAKQ